MKNLILAFALLVYAGAIAQEKPKEVKEETTERIIKVKDNEGTKEKKVKVITRETSEVALDENDKNKVNQDRVETPKKVERKVLVSTNEGSDYALLSQETYFVMEDKNFVFIPTQRGFSISNIDNKSVDVGKVWSTNTDGYYIFNGQMKNGIGYFNSDGNFTVEYYDKKSDAIIIETYIRKQDVN